MSVAQDGRWLIAPLPESAEGHVLKIWDLERGSDPEVLGEHTGTITAVGLSSDGQLAASVSDDKTLDAWDVKRRMRLAMFTAEYPFTCCALALMATPSRRAILMATSTCCASKVRKNIRFKNSQPRPQEEQRLEARINRR